MNLRTGPWQLRETFDVKPNGATVFSCFHCGGGSTMGYKLAGFDVLGGVEIDPKMMEIYRRNHKPRLSFLEGVQQFKERPIESLPADLLDLDILDGSPPCSSFSMAGAREKDWGKKKKFREGQADQVLDNLFFDFIDIAAKLRPKVVVSENVKGLVMGNARGYVKEILAAFDKAGYDTQLFLLNSSRMGVPQRRERTFFISRRRDLGMPKLTLDFNEAVIGVGDAIKGTIPNGEPLGKAVGSVWPRVIKGKSFSGAHMKGHLFSWRKLHPDLPAMTVTATHCMTHWDQPRLMSESEVVRIQTFPDDFDFCGQYGPYVCGMSVPPFMMQRVSAQIFDQLLKPLKAAGKPVVPKRDGPKANRP